MHHMLANMPALYSSIVFLTVRFVPVPTVDPQERMLVHGAAEVVSRVHASAVTHVTNRCKSCCSDAQRHGSFPAAFQ